MSIETSLGDYLEANVALAGGRVHAIELPQTPVLPALVFLRVSGVPTYSHDGDSNLPECRFQVSCWAVSYATVRQLAAQVKAVTGGYTGIMGDVEIGHCLCVGDRDDYEPETGRFHVPLDFMIAFNE